MLHFLRNPALALLLPLIAHNEGLAQPNVPESSLYAPKPSQDLSWAYGDWVAKGAHPVHGVVAEWRVKIGPNGLFVSELHKADGTEPSFERGGWKSTDREVWAFITSSRNGRQLPLPVMDLYSILVISPNALELRHMKSGKVLRLERGST